MKSLILGISLLASGFVHASYLPEADVRAICLKNFARTITCTATYKGKALSVDMDKESIKAITTNFFEHGIAINGFSKKTGFFGAFPRWEISCDPARGTLSGARYVEKMVSTATAHGSQANCR